MNIWRVPYIFAEEVAEKVIKTPLIHMAEDTLLCKHDATALYTMKTAYRLCHSISSQTTRANASANWNCIWKLDVSPKVKHFVWRLCQSRIASQYVSDSRRKGWVVLLLVQCAAHTSKPFGMP